MNNYNFIGDSNQESLIFLMLIDFINRRTIVNFLEKLCNIINNKEEYQEDNRSIIEIDNKDLK